MEEIHVPFNDKNSRVSSSGLRLVDMETQNFKCALRESWLISNKPGEKTPNTVGVLVIAAVAQLLLDCANVLDNWQCQITNVCVGWGRAGRN